MSLDDALENAHALLYMQHIGLNLEDITNQNIEQ